MQIKCEPILNFRLMKFRMLQFLFCMFLVNTGYSQKVDIKIKLIDSLHADASDYSFRITVKNVGLKQYWIQDTSYLLKSIYSRSAILIYAYLWKKVGNTYKTYEKEKRYVGTLLNKCDDSCCNCIYIPKGNSLSFSAPLLYNRKMEPGKYKMQIALRPPMNSAKGLKEEDSDFFYLNVR